MTMMDVGVAQHEESADFWARQFAGRWYRGPAHLANDFRRFTSAYRVPAAAQGDVRERARELLGEDWDDERMEADLFRALR
jgi:hypothetical protein